MTRSVYPMHYIVCLPNDNNSFIYFILGIDSFNSLGLSWCH